MATISLHIIAKDEIEQIRRIVTDYASYFDAIDVAVDDQISYDFLVKTYPNVNFYKYEWCKDFSHKRNFLRSKCQSDYYFRLDTDDKIINPENIRKTLEKATEKNIDIILTWYEYAKDIHGNVHAAHWRETIMRTKSKHKWNKRIHENVIPDNPDSWNIVLEKSIIIEHLLDASGLDVRRKRNLEYLTEEYNNNKETPDPRTLAYLGRMLYPMGKLMEAKFFLEEHIRLSGWDEDKMKSWVMLADILSDMGEHQRAIGACYEALNERTDFPDPYLKMSEIYNRMGDWKKSIHWGNIGLKQEAPLSTTLYDPSSYTWRPAVVLAYSYLMENDIVKAKKFFDIAEKLVPSLDWIVRNKKLFEEAVEQKDFVDRFVWFIRYLRSRQPELVNNVFLLIPDCLKKHELLVKLKQDLLPRKLWGEKDVEIFCGQAWEDWAAPSVISGIGGSEEAVIYLSRELVKRGYKVTVYCSCGELEGEYEGVTYKPYYEFNYRDDHNIVISWRNNICPLVPSAKKRYVWLHDVACGQITPENVKNVDKVIVLSEYHKSLFKDIPEDKLFVSANGINLPDFELKTPITRIPHRMIYTSSYDRGIEHLLHRWSDVRKEVPDAELHLFYGWVTYDEMMKIGRRPKEYRERMTKLMQQDGIFEHGRVGHKQLVKEFAKSKFWVYPSHFEEISCISGMKAQAMGCYPVCTNYAALKETIKQGALVDGSCGNPVVVDEYIKVLIECLKSQPTIDVDKAQFGWDKIAEQWDKELLTLKRRQYKNYDDYKSYYVTKGDFHTSNFTPDGQFMLHPRYQFIIDRIKQLGIKSLLDAGSSDGVMCFAVNKLCGIPADGVEADYKTVEFAREYALQNNYECTFANCLLEEHDTKKKYSAASALETIEHVLDPKKFLDKLESFVEDGGYVFICTPDKNGYYGEKNFNEQHINNFDKESLESLIGKDRIIEWANSADFLQVIYKK